MGLFDGFKKALGIGQADTNSLSSVPGHVFTGSAVIVPVGGGAPISNLPSEVASAYVSRVGNKVTVNVRFDAAKVGAKGSALSDVVLVHDASVSMGETYRSGKMAKAAAAVLAEVSKYDTDGIDFFAHSYGSRLEPKSFGQISTALNVEKMCANIMNNLGPGTYAAPALEMAERIKKPDGALNVIMFTDGAFGDKREVIAKITEWAKHCQMFGRPGMFHLHIVAIGNDIDMGYLEELDEGLNTPYDIVSLSHAADVLKSPAMIIRELEQTYVNVGTMGEIVVDAPNVLQVGNAKANHYEEGNEYYGYEELPLETQIGIVFEEKPASFDLTLRWKGGETKLTVPVN